MLPFLVHANGITVYSTSLALLLLACTGNASALMAQGCEPVFNYDGPLGDIEIIVDPDDSDNNLILTANLGERSQLTPKNSIVVTLLDGTTGQALSDIIEVARNFRGTNSAGPEFSYQVERGLGILYRGQEGVHSTWRRGGAWYRFIYDADGIRHGGTPPVLPGSAPKRDPFPMGTPPLGDPRLVEYAFSDYRKNWLGVVGSEARIELFELFDRYGIEVYDKSQIALHPFAASYVLFCGCIKSDSGQQSCGLYEAKLVFDANDFTAELSRLSDHDVLFERIAAARHPLTGSLVVFALTTSTLWVFESVTAHQPLREIASFFNDGSYQLEHPRIENSHDNLYLHLVDREGAGAGSYLVRYGEQPADPEWISPRGTGAELVYMPAADRLALFYKEAGKLVRCWVE